MKNPIKPESIPIYYQDYLDGKFHDGTLYTEIEEATLKKYFKRPDPWRRIVRLLESKYGTILNETDVGEFETAHQDYGTLMGSNLVRYYIIDINNLDPVNQMEFRKEVKAKRKNPELIPGGLAEGRKPEEFNQVQLKKGIKVEMEHTPDPAVAREIAMDHLVEDPDYYIKLAKMEKNPSGLVRTKKDEKKWEKAKKAVKRERGYGPKEFTDVDWGLVTHIYKSQNPKAETEAQRTFRYWFEQLYLTPAQKKVLTRLEKEAQFIFDNELFLESNGASIDEDSLLIQEPESVYITCHTLSDPSVGIFPLELFSIRIKADGDVELMYGRKYDLYMESYDEDEVDELKTFIQNLPNKLRG